MQWVAYCPWASYVGPAKRIPGDESLPIDSRPQRARRITKSARDATRQPAYLERYGERATGERATGIEPA
jgi:hypothetical protein